MGAVPLDYGNADMVCALLDRGAFINARREMTTVHMRGTTCSDALVK
jgi:hypothetical protein